MHECMIHMNTLYLMHVCPLHKQADYNLLGSSLGGRRVSSFDERALGRPLEY